MAFPILLIVFTVAIGGFLALIFWFFRKIFFKKYIPGIPIVPHHWFYGLADVFLTLDPRKLDVHFKSHEIVQKYGPISQFYILWNLIILVSDAKIAKYVFDHAKGKSSLVRRDDQKLRVKNIFALNTNDDWKIRRNKFRHAFTQASLKGYDHIMAGLVQRLITKLSVKAQNGEVVAIDNLLSRMALDVLFQMAYEYDLNFLDNESKFQEIEEGISSFFKLTWLANVPFHDKIRRLPIPLPGVFGKYRQAFSVITKLRTDVLHHLRKKYAEKSFISDCFGKLLMEFEEENQEKELNIMSDIFIFIIAGHETTAHTMSWLIYSFCQHPEIQEKCYAALQEHIQQQSKNGDEKFSIFSPLPDYIEACLKESMRKYPTAARGSTRLALDAKAGMDIPLPDGSMVHIPGNTLIQIPIYSLHHDVNNWGPDVEEFKPERWLNTAADGKDNNSSNANFASIAAYAGVGKASDELIFAPFSYGVRNCVGMNFAMWELRSVLYHLIKNFRFEFADDELRDEKKALQTDMLTMKPLKQMPVKLFLREQSK